MAFIASKLKPMDVDPGGQGRSSKIWSGNWRDTIIDVPPPKFVHLMCICEYGILI